MAWQVRVKQKMQDWAFPQVMASVTLAIFRTSDMEFDEIAQLVGEIEQTIYDFNENSKLLQQECLNETGILFGHSLHGELALIVKQEVEV